MSKLGNVGRFFLKVGKVAPAFLALYPALAPLAAPLTAAIQEAEMIPGATGAEKLAHVQAIAADAATDINAAAGHEVVNIADLHAAVDHGVSTVISAVNAIK